jgi:CheY-like chemotaxis protein
VEPLRVLVVEDEPIIGMMLQDTLLDLGCDVVALAHHFEAAMSYADAAELDVAVLDINLRGTRSYPVADLLAERGIPHLFTAGYGVHLDPAYRYAPVLEKPIEMAELRDALVKVTSSAFLRWEALHNASPPARAGLERAG